MSDAPDQLTVYRGGAITGDVVPVTTNRAVAERFAERAGVPVESFTVPKDSVLADVNAANSLGGNRPSFVESELLVRADDLKPTTSGPK